MKGVKTVLINKKPVRTEDNWNNSVHIIPPPPPVGCLTHSGVPIPSDGSTTVFAKGRNVVRKTTQLVQQLVYHLVHLQQ